jgi:hypothetical protein
MCRHANPVYATEALIETLRVVKGAFATVARLSDPNPWPMKKLRPLELRPIGAALERLLSVPSELGLLSEEYDITDKRLIGNFPQV